MAEHTQTALNLLQILIAIGAFKGIEILIKYLINRKKNKTNNIDDLYKKYSESCDTYIEQTEAMQKTITELRKTSIAMEHRLIEMDKKLDEKNEIINALKKEVHELTAQISKNSDVINELLKRAELLESIKCERDGCDDRIPPKKSIRIGKAKA